MYGNKYGDFSFFFDRIMAIENHKKQHMIL